MENFQRVMNFPSHPGQTSRGSLMEFTVGKFIETLGRPEILKFSSEFRCSPSDLSLVLKEIQGKSFVSSRPRDFIMEATKNIARRYFNCKGANLVDSVESLVQLGVRPRENYLSEKLWSGWFKSV